jgi:hypothetical protein
MINRLYIPGDFLDIYPYMNWLFLLCQDGDLLVARTEKLIEHRETHDALFRQATVPSLKSDVFLDIELNLEPFRKIATLADQFTFSDLRFFYSNILCGSNDGLHFISFDKNNEKIEKVEKITDAPIASLAAKYMTVFAASLEDTVTTLFGVQEGRFSSIGKTGSESSRIGISNDRIHYYMGAVDLSVAEYEREKVDLDGSDEKEKEAINNIDDARQYEYGSLEPDFVYNSNNGIFFKFGNQLQYNYKKNNVDNIARFDIGSSGKLIRAHLHNGATSFEFLEGLYFHRNEVWTELLSGECIGSRGYSNSKNFQNTVTAVNENGAFFFVI